MSAVSKVSDITVTDIAADLRLTEVTQGEEDQLSTLFGVAKSFIKNYTGRTTEELDAHEDYVIVVYILVQDMWDNRVMYVDNNNMNKVVETILGMHQINLLPEAEDD